MRIVFFGASELGYRCCERLLATGQNVVGIFTLPRAFAISYSPGRPVTNVLHRDFRTLGVEHGLPVVVVEEKMQRYASEVERLGPDLLVAIGWYHLIPPAIRDLAPRGCVGVHASLLPRYRGGAPLVWAIINGESETGVSLFYLSDGIDDGDIVAQSCFPIAPEDTIREVLAKATTASLELMETMIPRIADGTAPRRAQDHALATYVPQRSPADGQIDWSWEPERIRNFIRAQTRPYPGAFTMVGGKRVTIWDASISEVRDAESGS